MAITDKEQGVWELEQVYNKINQGSIWDYSGVRQLWIWGRNQQGSLGQNNLTERSSPVQVGTNAAFLSVNSGGQGQTTYAINSSNELWVWGYGNGGALGLNGPNAARSSPVQIPGSWTSAIGSGGEPLAMGVKTDGTLWSWGAQEYGALGHNQAETSYSSPKQVGSDTDWATGFDKYYPQGHTAWMLKTDGTLWATGYGSSGSLGLGNYTHRSSPTQVGTATNWSVVGRNYGNSNAVINTDGELWVVGGNSHGALGQNNTTASTTLVQIPGTTWKCQTGTDEGMIATKTDGTLWSWGRNDNGEMGHNNGTQYESPKQVPGTTWDRVISGYSSVIATKTDGTMWTWGGDNAYGQLGQNNTTQYSSPVQMGTDTDWLSTAGSMSGQSSSGTGFGLKLL